MSDSFIPRSDANALIWFQGFSSGVSANWAALQLAESDSILIADAVQEFADALVVSTTPGSRTQETVNIKDTKRNSVEELCRQYAIDITYNSGIDDSLKIAIGVRPVNNSREAVHCPQTVPLLNIVASTPGSQTVTFADALDPNKRARPIGAIGLQLYRYIGDEATEDEDLCTFVGMFTRSPIAVEYNSADDGRMATFVAKWVGTRGDTSPFSLPISMRIAA